MQSVSVRPYSNSLEETLAVGMGRKGNMIATVREYAEASTVHGVSYVFSRSQIYFTRKSYDKLSDDGTVSTLAQCMIKNLDFGRTWALNL